jgi:hypothetical protein
MSFDFTKLDFATKAEAGAVMQVKNPLTGEALGATVTVIGTDSKTFRNLAKQRSVASMERTAEDLKTYDADADNISMIAKCILGWTGIFEGETEIKFSYENAVMMLTKYSWLREQIDRFVGDRANFLPSA